jgi:hypothetical protein
MQAIELGGACLRFTIEAHHLPGPFAKLAADKPIKCLPA